ncbi:MAG: septum formation initiator family protein [Firmicutes bacterium]|nr:septum formation initiator family protein [Bacillota bacterium]
MARDERGKKRRFPPWIILGFVLLLWVGLNFAKNAVANYRLKKEITALERRLEVLELRGLELEKEIANWQCLENVERVAREELGLVKPGETVYILSQPLEEDLELDVKKR